MEMKLKLLILIISLGHHYSYGKVPLTKYTLYRNSFFDPKSRIHVATFDAQEKGTYNQENCFDAVKLYMNQEGIKTKFWCEKGGFKD